MRAKVRPEKSAEKDMRTIIITYSTPGGTLDTHVSSGSQVGREEEDDVFMAAITGRSVISSDADSHASVEDADRKYRAAELLAMSVRKIMSAKDKSPSENTITVMNRRIQDGGQ
jgi:hypothetical protein